MSHWNFNPVKTDTRTDLRVATPFQDAYHIRCLKPNDTKQSNHMDPARCLQQVRGENVNVIRRAVCSLLADVDLRVMNADFDLSFWSPQLHLILSPSVSSYMSESSSVLVRSLSRVVFVLFLQINQLLLVETAQVRKQGFKTHWSFERFCCRYKTVEKYVLVQKKVFSEIIAMRWIATNSEQGVIYPVSHRSLRNKFWALRTNCETQSKKVWIKKIICKAVQSMHRTRFAAACAIAIASTIDQPETPGAATAQPGAGPELASSGLLLKTRSILIWARIRFGTARQGDLLGRGRVFALEDFLEMAVNLSTVSKWKKELDVLGEWLHYDEATVR